MNSDDYFTDASSLDALSQHSETFETEKTFIVQDGLFSPVSVCSTNFNESVLLPSTPTPIVYTQPKIAYLIGARLLQDTKLLSALKDLEIEAIVFDEANISATSFDCPSSIAVFEDFSGTFFEALRKRQGVNRNKIFGPPAVKEASESKERRLPMSRSGYPIYCRHLSNCRVSATGMRSKEQLHEIRRIILYMDGTFLEREGPLTHLVAAKCRGNKYRDAVALGKPILKPDWVEYLWRHKNVSPLDVNTSIDSFKVKAFYACKIALEGFDPTEKANMVKLIEENGGQAVPIDDVTSTHIVRGNTVDGCAPRATLTSTAILQREAAETQEDVWSPLKRPRFDLHVINDLNETEASAAKQKEFLAERAKVLKVEWFWSSIQIEACADERAYSFDNKNLEEMGNKSIGTPSSFASPIFVLSDTEATPNSGTPGSTGRRKRKRMRDLISSLSQVDCPPFIPEVNEDTGKVNLGGTSLDQSDDVISDAEFVTILKKLSSYLNSADLKTMSPRQIEFVHLLQTERNYVSILMNVVKNFKEPCEKEDQAGGKILTSLEVKTIFSPILPIYALHRRLLRDLFKLQSDWNEENLIGQIYVKYANELRKSYEPFINFFETIKCEIARCEGEKPRFLAFLRIAQGKPECGKQTLADLMIRPVQRLPSTALILVNLAKHTTKTNPDAEWIAKGLEAINQVNQTINEEKKRTDARIAMFDVFHEIDGCPVELLSDHRTLLHKLDVTSLNDTWGQKYDPITLCVFSDHIQIVKRRGAAANKNLSSAASVANLRSPSVSRKSYIQGPSVGKRYKFLEWIAFVHIRKVVDVTDMTSSFAFVVRAPNEFKERHLVFTTPDDPIWTKSYAVTFFAKQIAGAVDRVDYEYLCAKADTSVLHISEGCSVLEKAARFATKTSKKVGRALSLTRTPSRLKRTVSQIMSPFSSKNQDPDAISQNGNDISTTPLRTNLSTMSLWFGSKRGPVDGTSTPRRRKPLGGDKESRKNIPCIQEL